MRMDTHKAGRWLMGVAVALSMVSGSAGAAALSAPYSLRGYDWGNGWIQYAASSDGGMLVLTNRSDLETDTVTRYGGDGQVLGTHSMPSQRGDIASNRRGNYVTANVTAQGVFATVFNRNGVAIVPRFQVSTRGQSLQVAMNDAGVFVVVYNTYVQQPGSSPTINSTYARVFNPDGSARTNEFLIASGPNEVNVHSWALGIDGAGTFTVSLLRVSPGRSEQRILRYTRDGVFQGGIDDPTGRAVNGEMVGETVTLAVNNAGQHVLGWMGAYLPTRSSFTRFQRFAANGDRSGPIVLLDGDAPGAGYGHDMANVAIAGDGRVVAVWSQRSSATDPNSQWHVFGREFRADGTPLTDAFRIDTAPATALLYPATLTMVMTPDGQYTATWYEVDGGQGRYWARRFRMEGGPPVQALSSGVPVGGLSGAINSFQYFRFTVPPNTPSFTVTLNGGGDADMFIRYGEPPTLASYDLATGIPGSNEGAMVNNPPPGDFYVGLFGYSAYSGVSLQADW